MGTTKTQFGQWWGGLDVCFDIHEVRQAERLKDARQTGFVWSQRPGSVVVAVNRMYFERAAANPHVAVIVAPESALTAGEYDKAVIVSPQAHELFLHIHNLAIHEPKTPPPPRVDSTAEVADSARLGDGVCLGERVIVGHQVTILGPAEIGPGTTIEAGAVIGSEGLFAKRIGQKLTQVRHYGGVRIGRDCFVHSGAVISRSANYGNFTELADAVHIGIQAIVGHDAFVGAESIVSSNAVIAGRAYIGSGAWIGASATVSNMVNVGDAARVNIGAVCLHDVPSGGEVSGNFALDHRAVMRRYMAERRDARK